MGRTQTNYPQPTIGGIEKKEAPKWWESDWIQALGTLGAIASISAPLVALFSSASTITSWWPWFAILACILLAPAGFKMYRRRHNKTLIFIADEMQSWWSLAKQPEDSFVSQIALDVQVSNTSHQPVQILKVRLVRPKAEHLRADVLLPMQGSP